MKRINYRGDDTAQYIHNNQTHRTMSDAFKDADYASPITKFRSDTWKALEFFAIASLFASMGVVVCWVALAVSRA